MPTAVVVWLVVLFTVGAGAMLHHGVLAFTRALRDPDHPDAPLWLIRSIRDLLVVVCGAAIGFGLWLEIDALLWTGGVILAEELYETGVAEFIARRGRGVSAVA